MIEYEIRWTCFNGYIEFEGYTNIVAPTVEDAERIYFNTRREMNPYKGNFTGYCIENIVPLFEFQKEEKA